MPRFTLAASLLLCAVSAVAATTTASDSVAVTLAQQSVSALTAGASIGDVTLNANAISVLGADYQTGTATLEAKSLGESRVDLNLSGRTRSDVRNAANGFPAGAWETNGGTSTPYAGHNCWTDAAWFFPALSSLTQTANPNFIFKYIGQEQHGGVNTQHIQIFQIPTQGIRLLPRLSTMDFYLSSTSYLPVAVAFDTHPDNDANTDISVEVRFTGYQAVSGIQVPFHFQRMLNGGVILDVTVTTAVVNTGLADSLFSLQ